VLEKTNESLRLTIPISNIKRENIFVLQLKSLRRKVPL
jgi:hypothetical protein